MRASRILLIASVAALGACGREADLKPAPGQPMPVKPMMAKTTPTVAELLTPPSYTRPGRVDELVKRSQPRPQDPFDLPPPTGGTAPSLPAGSDPGAVATDTTPVPPK